MRFSLCFRSVFLALQGIRAVRWNNYITTLKPWSWMCSVIAENLLVVSTDRGKFLRRVSDAISLQIANSVASSLHNSSSYSVTKASSFPFSASYAWSQREVEPLPSRAFALGDWNAPMSFEDFSSEPLPSLACCLSSS